MDIDLNCSSFSFSGISMGVKVFSTKVYKRKRFKGPFYLHYEWKSLGDENEEPVDNFSYFSGGGGTPYSGLYGEVPPERGTFFFQKRHIKG